MEKNMAGWDRIARFVVALVLVALGFTVVQSGWRWLLYIVGAIFVVTSLWGFCPLYVLFGIKTSRQ